MVMVALLSFATSQTLSDGVSALSCLQAAFEQLRFVA
jgi:hypothetical protein